MLTVLDSATVPLDPASLPAARIDALYVHVPFCFHKCHYCDFYSITRQTPERMARFIDLILAEADLWNATPVTTLPKTVFFGGGTPTLLPVDEMRRLLDGLRERIDFSDVNEWTIEANPATVTHEYCAMLREQGVDRLSFGAQSFDPAELKLLERHHDPDDVPRSVETARGAGFTRLNLDLIFAIPGQTLESWGRSLDAAIALGTPHLSCYGLTYEPYTPIAVRRRMGQFEQIEESIELEMLRHTRRHLAALGLAPYEISNYAREGEACRHNLVYWTGGNYLGLGPSAASHVQGWRWRNRPHLGEWERAVEGSGEGAGFRVQGSGNTEDASISVSSLNPEPRTLNPALPRTLNPCLPAIEVEHLTPRRRAGELAMLLLRLTRGLNFADFSARSGFDARKIFADPLERFARVGLLDVDEYRVCLTERGLVVADALSAELLHSTD
ncbi:MAG: radical SAM family heme chaperone HemW [Tepidisphaeraceae bacterium]